MPYFFPKIEKDAVKLPGIKDFFSNFKARNLEIF